MVQLVLDDFQRNVVHPGLVTPSLAEGMISKVPFESDFFAKFRQQEPRRLPSDAFGAERESLLLEEYEIFRISRNLWIFFGVLPQSGADFGRNGDPCTLSRLRLLYIEKFPRSAIVFEQVPDPQPEEVGNAEGRIDTKFEEKEVADISVGSEDILDLRDFPDFTNRFYEVHTLDLTA